MTDTDCYQFSARFDTFSSRPPTNSAVERVRDVIICVTDATVDHDASEVREHPPIGFRPVGRPASAAETVDLGDGVTISRLPQRDADLVMNACEPRGHYFVPVRQFGQRYSFTREVARDSHEENPYRWDDEGTLSDALMLSRIVRDNAYSTQYAARLVDYEDGEQQVVYTLSSEGKSVYRFRHNREWLDLGEGAQLKQLFGAFRAVGEPPPRVRRAIWRAEYASWVRWADLALPLLVGGLEALLKTERHRATAQFVARVPALAAELGVDAVSTGMCERMYDARSDWVHGAHVRLFTTGPESQERRDAGTAQGASTKDQSEALSEIALVQDVLRAAVRRCIEDATFRETFEDDDRIRSRWSLGR